MHLHKALRNESCIEQAKEAGITPWESNSNEKSLQIQQKKALKTAAGKFQDNFPYFCVN